MIFYKTGQKKREQFIAGNRWKRFALGLTGTQQRIVQLGAEGVDVQEIAATLQSDPETVKTHRYKALHKTGWYTVQELARVYPFIPTPKT